MADSKIFKAGDKLVDGSQPFVIQVADTDRDIRCHYCLNLCDHLKACAGCHQVKYCSKQCQTSDWKDVHKHNECKLLKNTPDFPYHAKWRFFVRLVCKVTFDPQSRQRLYPLWDGRQRKFEDFMSHEDKNLGETNFGLIGLMVCFRQLISQFDKLFAVKLTTIELYRWWGMQRINCQEVGNQNFYASANYIDGSALDHDCRPSCVCWYNGRQLQVRAMRTIDLSVEEPTIPYIDCGKDREYRRKLLSERHFFECQCRRCAEHTDRDFDFDRYEHLLANQKDRSVDYWEEVIAMERALGGPHSPEVTTYLFAKCTAIRKSLGKRSSRPLLKKWYALANEVKEEFEITHGVDHPYYEKVMTDVREADEMCAQMQFLNLLR